MPARSPTLPCGHEDAETVGKRPDSSGCPPGQANDFFAEPAPALARGNASCSSPCNANGVRVPSRDFGYSEHGPVAIVCPKISGANVPSRAASDAGAGQEPGGRGRRVSGKNLAAPPGGDAARSSVDGECRLRIESGGNQRRRREPARPARPRSAMAPGAGTAAYIEVWSSTAHMRLLVGSALSITTPQLPTKLERLASVAP